MRGQRRPAQCLVPQTVETWYIPGKSPIRVSQLHRAVGFDIATGRPGCPPYAPEATRFEVFEFWSSDMLKLFREAGMPRRRPPAMPACADEDSSETPHIISPRLSLSYTIRGSRPEGAIALEASAAADVRTMFWFDGTALVGKVTDSTLAPETAGATAESSGAPVLPALPWRPSAEGVHLIRVIDDHGRAAERKVEVQFAP
jgi:penicillin-binding protein 1C